MGSITERSISYAGIIGCMAPFMGRKQTGFFFLLFFVEREISAQLPQSVRKEHVRLGPDACWSSLSALCQTRKFDGKRWNAAFLSLPQRNATMGFDLLEPAEPFASEANERDETGDEDEEEGVLEYDFSDSVEDSEE